MGKRLDASDRKGPKAVLAENAVQTSAGMGNMCAALAEAVMLSGIERNSDVMPMASWAPLLANSVRARKIRGDGGFVIRFAKQDDGMPDLAWFIGVRHQASTLLVWGGGGNQDVAANQLESTFSGALAPAVAGSIEEDRWYEVKIQVERWQVRCYLDGKEIHTVQLSKSLGPSLFAEAGRAASGDIVLRLMNASPGKQTLSIDLAGGHPGRYSAVVTHLHAEDLDEENSLAEPTTISPIQHPPMSVGGEFK